MLRNFRRYVMQGGGTSKAVSYALAESTPGESEPSVTAEPSAEPSTEPSAEPTPATPGEAKPSTEPTSEPTSEPTAAPTDEPSPEPTFVPTPEPTSAPASDSSSSSGSTTNAAATVESTATPAPVLSSTEQVEKTFDFISSIEKENAVVELLGTEEIFSDKEYAEVTKLPLQEQILVTLSSVGCDQIAQSIINSLNLTLSSKANELTAQLGSTEKLTARECEQKLAETFPAYQVKVNGVTYRFYVMTAQVKVNGVTQNYHFGFRLDENGEWVLVHLDEAALIPIA